MKQVEIYTDGSCRRNPGPGGWGAVLVYGGREICAAASHGSVLGCQFHPEKSGAVGLKIIEEFLK